MAENVMKIDLARQVSRISPAERKAAVSGSQETDFADMLKRKEQISDALDKKAEASAEKASKDSEKDVAADKKDAGSNKAAEKSNTAVQEELAGAQVLSETMLKLQSAVNQLLDNYKVENALNVQAAGETVTQTGAIASPAAAETSISETVTAGVSVAEAVTAETSVAEAAPATEAVQAPQMPENKAAKTELQAQQGTQAKQDILQEQAQVKQDILQAQTAQNSAAAEDGAAVNPLMDAVNAAREKKLEGNQTPAEADSHAEQPEITKTEADLKQPPAFPEERQGQSDESAADSGQQLKDEGQVQAMGHQEQRAATAVENRLAQTPVVKTTPETLHTDLGKALADKLPQKDGTLTIDLEPASLGKLTIKVVYEEGRALVSILSSNQKTLELLSQRAADIAGILEEKTGQQTVIYTQPPEQQPFEEKQDSQDKGQQRQDREEDKRQSRPDTFAQQLRLGLV